MPTQTLDSAQRSLRYGMILLGILTFGIVGVSIYGSTANEAMARLVRPPASELPWKVIESADVSSGATIAGSTHTIIHLPGNFETIGRETLLGHKGTYVRYWGYCFPENFDPTVVDKRRGFPGLIFLSEKERQVRREAEAAMRRRLSPTYIPTTEKDVNDYLSRTSPPIRHQLETFKPNTLCYVMSEAELAIGMDGDKDQLNSRLERDLKTDPKKSDTDGDGIIDGIEHLSGTNPTIRDSDADGIIDGLEDRNWNGKFDMGESDPRMNDSDRDGLCDGYCRVQLANSQYVFMGEDENLNGIVDTGESSPIRYDSDEDGYSDHVEYLMCLADEGDECNGLSIN